MSMGGLKKQFNKANQFMSEKMGGVKGTEHESEYREMEKHIDALEKLVDELVNKTQEMLQPNPVSRTKMMTMKSMSKIRGQHNPLLYPQPEGQFSDSVTKYARDLGETSILAEALTELGDGYRQLADNKYSLEDSVKQNFIYPLQQLQSKELKEVNHHRKKLESRRLDYDFKKRKQQKDGSSSVSDDEVRQAEEKFEESKSLAEVAMQNLIDNEVEQVSQIAAFVEAQLNYHQLATDVLQKILSSLRTKCDEAASRPKSQRLPRKMTTSSTGSDKSQNYHSYNDLSASDYKASSDYKMPTSISYHGSSYGGGMGASSLLDFNSDPVYSTVNKPPTSAKPGRGKQPCAEALYDFEPENDNEVGFREGDTVTLVSRVDDNWFEGTVNGQTGLFPVNYVKIIVDLP